jgi:hypothetical protein
MLESWGFSGVTRYGHHVYIVAGGDATPRFAYTIGLSRRLGFELILAGGVTFDRDEVLRIIAVVVSELSKPNRALDKRVSVDSLGDFSLRPVHATWPKDFVLGALDFYGLSSLPALQIVPDEKHWTADVPDMEEPWSTETEPVWQWLEVPWSYPVPISSLVTTNLAALRGKRVTEVMRWGDDSWEIFAGEGPDIPEREIRVVALGTILAIDKSLAFATELKVEKGAWRDEDAEEWHPWG